MKRAFLLCTTAAATFLICSPAQADPFEVGDIFAGVANGTVAHYDNSGVFIENLNSGQGGYTTGMAFDGAGNLLSTNFSAGNITRYDTNGTIILPNPYVSPGASPESISFAADGSFYVGRAGGEAQHYSAGGTLLQTFSMGQPTDWLDLAADQTTLFYNDEGGNIRRWDVASNLSLADFANNTANGGSRSFALRILGNGDVLSAADNIITQYDAAGAFLGSYDVASTDGFFALNLDPDGTHFWSGSFNDNSLYRFSLGNFGTNVSDFSFGTGGQLFGVALAGELTVGGPPTEGAVPEPSTWALLLIGFFGIGSILRLPRRKRSVAVSYASVATLA